MKKYEKDKSKDQVKLYKSVTNETSVYEIDQEFKLSSAIKQLVLSLIPISLNYFVNFSLQSVLIIFLKQSNMDDLTGALGLGTYWLQIVVLYFIADLNVGFKARASHAFGAKNFKEVGFYLHKAFMINYMLLVPSLLCIIFSDSIFTKYMGVEYELAQKAKFLLVKLIPSIFFFVVQDTLTAYMNSCHFFGFPAWVQIISNVSYWFTSFIFVGMLALGMDGIAICQFLLYFSACFMLIIYIWRKNPYPETLFNFSFKSREGLMDMLKFSLSLGFMSYLDDISGSIISLLSSGIDEYELSSFVIMRAVYIMFYCVPCGLQLVCLPYISSSIGEKNIAKGKKYLKAGILCALIASIFSVFIITFFSEFIFSYYSSNMQHIKYAIKILRLYMIVMPCDFVQMVLGVALRALGMQKLGIMVFIFCNYLIAIPLASYLSSVEGYGSYGLAVGEVSGCFAKFICFSFITYKLDWEKEAQKLEKKKLIDEAEGIDKEEEEKVNA